MTDLATMLAAPALEATAFPPNSRYHGVGITTRTLPDGSARAYLQRRFVPQPGELEVVGRHRVPSGARADTIAAAVLGDPVRMWQLCDANAASAQALTARPGQPIDVAVPRAAGSTTGA
jgi:hypothetical protein